MRLNERENEARYCAQSSIIAIRYSYTNSGYLEIFAGHSRYSLTERETLDAFELLGRCSALSARRSPQIQHNKLLLLKSIP